MIGKKHAYLILLILFLNSCSPPTQKTTILPSYSLKIIEVGQEYQSFLATDEDIWLIKTNTLTQLKGDGSFEKKDFTIPVDGEDDLDIAWDGEFIWISAYLGDSDNNWLGKFDIECSCIVFDYYFNSEPFAISYGGGAIWILSHIRTQYFVSKFNISSGAIEYEIQLNSSVPSKVVWHESGLWVLDWSTNQVKIYDVQTGRLLTTYATGENPSGIAFTETHAWIVNRSDFSITMISLSGDEIASTFPINCSAFPDCEGNDIVIINNQAIVNSLKSEKVSTIDLQSLETLQDFDVRKPQAIIGFENQVIILNGDRGRVDKGKTITIINP